jgi:hypothetical protein
MSFPQKPHTAFVFLRNTLSHPLSHALSHSLSLFFLGFFLLFSVSSTLANKTTDTTKPAENTTDDAAKPQGGFENGGQNDSTIILREKFPGQSGVIDVSVETGSINILSTYISGIFKFVLALSIIIAVLVTMAAGFMIMTAGGDTAARGEAKDMIVKTFLGLALLLLSGLFLKTINPNFYVL